MCRCRCTALTLPYLFGLGIPPASRTKKIAKSVITLSRQPTISSLKITDRSFGYASLRLWNQLPDSLCQPRQSCLDSPPHSLVRSSLLSSPLSSSFTRSLQAQNILFQQILPILDFFYIGRSDCLHDITKVRNSRAAHRVLME